MLLAFDDTDSPDGGCTTHALLRVLLALPELAPRSLPRLVRLNPNVPWKTRGNGAVCVELGVPEGPAARFGELRGLELRVFPEGRPAAPSQEVLGLVWDALLEVSRPGSSPAVALFSSPPSAFHYDAAVKTVVDPADARDVLEAEGALWRAAGDGRGLVGCLGAAAWPGPPASYEFLAYREPARWGTPRDVDPTPLALLDARGATFHTWDPVARRPACIPATPDPVLCGLRGRDPDVLRDTAVEALLSAAKEPVDAWLLYASNQASGDHVTAVESVLEAPELGTVEVEAEVTGAPRRIQGGHVLVAVADAAGVAFTAAAFEPTGAFRDVVAALMPGDRVRVTGAYAEDTVRLERLEVLALAEMVRKAANPVCCGRSMKSRGAGGGYRCAVCGRRAAADEAKVERVERTLAVGAYEVPVMARRHLHRPL